MHADGGVDERVALGQPDRDFQIGRTVAVPIASMRVDARGQRAFDHLLAVGIELSNRPDGSANRPASLQARSHRDIFVEAGQHGLAAFDATPPRSSRCDSMPFSLRGCRFATITTLRPSNCSGV